MRNDRSAGPPQKGRSRCLRRAEKRAPTPRTLPARRDYATTQREVLLLPLAWSSVSRRTRSQLCLIITLNSEIYLGPSAGTVELMVAYRSPAILSRFPTLLAHPALLSDRARPQSGSKTAVDTTSESRSLSAPQRLTKNGISYECQYPSKRYTKEVPTDAENKSRRETCPRPSD